MFFDTLQALCDEKGIAMSALLDQVGMSRGNIARWKATEETHYNKISGGLPLFSGEGPPL